MNLPSNRILHVKGTPYDVGFELGRSVSTRLEKTISRCIEEGPVRVGTIDAARMRREALPWMESIPARFRDEMVGLAKGAGLPVQCVAEWTYVEACTEVGCSSLLYTDKGQTWVGRNNDLWAPSLWGHLIVRTIDGRIPTMAIGMEAETFTATGINAHRLWLHYHLLPPLDEDSDIDRDHAWFEFAWMTEALETCSTIEEIEAWLAKQDRLGSMLLFVVEGAT